MSWLSTIRFARKVLPGGRLDAGALVREPLPGATQATQPPEHGEPQPDHAAIAAAAATATATRTAQQLLLVLR